MTISHSKSQLKMTSLSKKKSGRVAIVYVIDSLASKEGLTGGTERQLLDLLKHVDNTKFRPILICLREYVKIEAWDDLSCEKYILNVHSLTSLSSLLSFISFVRFLRKNRIDILQTFFFDSTLFGVLAGRLSGVKNVISSRRDMGFWHTYSSLKIMSILKHFTKRILVNSNAVKDAIVRQEKVSPESIDVIYNGVDIEKIDHEQSVSLSLEFKEIKREDIIVGMVANFNRKVKRVDVFLKAAAEVVVDVSNVKFLLVGGGKLESELRQLVRNLGVENIVIFAGKKPNAIPYIKRFDIGVITSDSEGFSNTILEYMVLGLPVIATDVGGNRELIEHGSTGMLVPPGDYKAIADSIDRLLNDRYTRSRMGDMARQVIIKRYAWTQKSIELEEYYLSIISD